MNMAETAATFTSSLSMLLSLLLLFGLSTFSAASPLPWNVTEEQSLLGFKAAITSDPHHSLAHWTSNVSFCTWKGVQCSSQRVVRLNLSSMDLEGTISPLLGNLSALQVLDLSNNSLHGDIPSELGQLSHAKVLQLGDNHFAGEIPATLGGCSSLVELGLGFNELQGNIPTELTSLSHLKVLDLGANSLTGTIPSSIGNISSLIILDLGGNKLKGIIPTELGTLGQLQLLHLQSNELSGTIPSSIGNISVLTELGLSTNNLSGSIPFELGWLIKLNVLYLSENRLSGPIPTSLLNCTSLVDLVLNENELSGYIPWELGNKLNNLQTLLLWGNRLFGKIPNSLGNCSSLKDLVLSENSLSGMVPMELGKLSLLEKLLLFNNLLSSRNTELTFLTALTNCSNLEWLEVSQNQLTGTLPPSIGHLSPKLSRLSLRDNKIRGNIPEAITNLSNLNILYLHNNLLSGHIPFGIGRLYKMESFDLRHNLLEGSIPIEIGQLQHLGELRLEHNSLSGLIPDSLGGLPQLRRLRLNNNNFSGEIPLGFSKCQTMELLDLSHNRLTGKIPGEVLTSLKTLQFYLNLSSNLLQGALPQEISKIIMVQGIDISNNKLTGDIPGVLENCLALEYLNLSRNAFRGPIPDALSKLQNLQVIDLSSNFLSGLVPMSLGELKVVHYINVCFNNLSGPISEGLFPNSTVTVLFIGNPGLCGPKRYLLPMCAKQGQRKHSVLKKGILFGVGVVAVAFLLLILGIRWRWNFLRGQIDISNILMGNLGYQMFSYEDLLIASNGFNETNLLGVGNFGSVYKGTLKDGKTVAIKVLNMQNEMGQKSFKIECKVLGRIRHRNLIKVVSACSHSNFNCIVLEFASNGSLEKLLHEESNDEDICAVTLTECLSISIDVAHGLEYLHHDSSPQVVHCDLKPSNVLLDDDMKACVTDFGISRLTGHANSMNSLSTSFALRGSTGYIAPEYGLGGRASTKGDVYSYGILLLEMITRRRPTDPIFVGDLDLRKWVRSAFPNRLADIVDNRLLRNVTMEQHRCLISFIHVGLLCTHESPHQRPTMRDVARGLESLRSAYMGNAATASNLTATLSDLAQSARTHARVEGMSSSQSSTF